MGSGNRQEHWQNVYTSKGEKEVSWFEEHPAPSLEMIELAGALPSATIVDVGGGASRLIDALLDRGFRHLVVLDLSEAALQIARDRLGDRQDLVSWVVADVTRWRPPAAAFDVWHDRATFHFLTEEADRAAYVATLKRALKPGGHAIMATFAPDGPERCSGLPVVRYDAVGLGQTLGSSFELVATRRHAHRTPRGSSQSFQLSVFRRQQP